MNLDKFSLYPYSLKPTPLEIERTDLSIVLSRMNWFAIRCVLLPFHHTYLGTEVLFRQVMRGHSTLPNPAWGQWVSPRE